MKSAPSIPTIGESGVPGYEADLWFGTFVPKDPPVAIVDRLNQENCTSPESFERNFPRWDLPWSEIRLSSFVLI